MSPTKNLDPLRELRFAQIPHFQNNLDCSKKFKATYCLSESNITINKITSVFTV